MQKSGIEWTNYVNNTVTGCLRRCPYCFAIKVAENPRFKKGFPNGFKLTFHPDRVMEPSRHKRPELIFADSMSDLFGDGVKQEWVEETFGGFGAAQQHIFQVLTKTPENIIPMLYGSKYLGGGDYYENVWLGVSVDRAENISRITELKKLSQRADWHLFVSFEPLLTEMPDNLRTYLKGIEWVIVGQQTKPFNHPNPGWVVDIGYTANTMDIPVFIKNNLMPHMGLSAVKSDYQKFPKEMNELISKRNDYNESRKTSRKIE